MTIPVAANTYTQATGTATSNQFKFVARDPGAYDIKYPLYTGWVNTETFAIWYLESFSSELGVTTAQWRAVGPIVLMTRSPVSSDFLYPIGQTWVNTAANAYWVLVALAGTTATWIQLSAGGGNGIDSLTGNTGGAVFGDSANNVNLVGSSGQIVVAGNPGTNTLTISLAGGSTAIDSVQVDAFTGPGTNPVLPTALGLITVTGGQTPAGTTNNVIRTDSLAANTYTVQVQRSQAVGSSTVGDNGVSHYNSADFTVDSNGFVSLVGGAETAPNIQIFLSGSGTYTTPTSPSPLYLYVIAIGPGGGGGASITNDGNDGSGATTFGAISAGAGKAGQCSNNGAMGGQGGNVTLGLGTGIAIQGGDGQGGSPGIDGTSGGSGGTNAFGGAGGGATSVDGSDGSPNSGAGGGGGGGVLAVSSSSGGGGAGGYVATYITSPSASYSYSVGTGGAGGASTVDPGSFAGGDGAEGIIQVIAYYQ